jgi:hypothetical protein
VSARCPQIERHFSHATTRKPAFSCWPTCSISKTEPGKLGSLIGQSFLRRLHSVEQRGDQMVLRP